MTDFATVDLPVYVTVIAFYMYLIFITLTAED